MVTLNFPANPDVGNQYTLGTKTWTFNGKGWQLTQQAGQVSLPFTLLSGLILTSAEALPNQTTYDFNLVTYI